MQCLETIQERIQIAKFDLFSEKCVGHLNKLTKLANIANKPYLQKVTMVVVSDLESDIDWEVVTKTYLEASDGKTLYQIIDLAQLRSLVGTAQSRMQFVTNVIVRWVKARDAKTFKIHARVWRKGEHPA